MRVEIDESGEADENAGAHRDAEREPVAARVLLKAFRQPSISDRVSISCHDLSILHHIRAAKMTGHHTRYTHTQSICPNLSSLEASHRRSFDKKGKGALFSALAYQPMQGKRLPWK